jgi:hypothetical protein
LECTRPGKRTKGENLKSNGEQPMLGENETKFAKAPDTKSGV